MSKWLKFSLFFFIFWLSGCETRTTIVNNISEREANEILVLLASKGIPALKIAAPAAAVGGGAAQQMWDISVPSAHVTESLGILNQSGLPRAKGTSLLDLFGTPGIVPSDLQDRIRYQEGLSEQLAMTIRKMDGVVDADVQITFPREDEEPKKALTASVYIRYRGVLDASNNLLITKIKRLVSSAIPGLTVENVTVVADRALYSDAGFSEARGSPLSSQGLVSIWSIVQTKDSTWRFRIIFYTFILVIFILASLLIALLWKFYPVIKDKGIKFFIRPEQITIDSLQRLPLVTPLPEEENR